MVRRVIAVTALSLALGALVAAQGNRPASPRASAATQTGGAYGGANNSYQNGKWIEITYGAPIKRGRDLWGTGASYGKLVAGDAPVWRAGADQTTRLKTEVPLVINGKTVAPGEYSVFIDLKPNAWTLILSTWAHQTSYQPNNREALWGAYNYTPDKDVVRAPMTLAALPVSVDQLTWQFADVTNAGGKLAIMWDKVLATTAFTIGR
jgi:hypothetical protein